MLTPGARLADRYRIDAVVGHGGTAIVYRAHDERLARDVAIKVLLEPLADDPAVVARFEREARSLAAVHDPRVIAVHDVVDGDGADPAFLVLELADGGTLASRLADGPLSPEDVAGLIGAVAGGLDAVHLAGLVHRDVKPANILFAGGEPKLGDLGIARTPGPAGRAPDDPTITSDGLLVGTLRYVAPEVLEGAPATAASDLYGLAAIAFEALAGRPLRTATSFAGLVAEARARPPALSSLVPVVGRAFDAVFADALAPEPDRRPGVLAFADALWQAVKGPAVPDDATAPTIVVAPTADDPATAETIVVPPPAPVAPARAAAASAASAPSAAPAAADASRQGRRPSLQRPLVVLLVVAAGVVILLAVANALPGLSILRPGSGGATEPATATTPAATPSAEPTAAPTAWPDGPTQDPAIAAIDALGAAIDAARGGNDGLKGKEANDLGRGLDAVVRALADGERATAREAAAKLADRVTKATDDKRVSDAHRDRLRTAARALVDALAA